MDVWDIIAHDSGMILAFSTFLIFIYFLNKLRNVRKTTREILPFVGIVLLVLAATISFSVESWRIILGVLGAYSTKVNIILYGIQFLAIIGTVEFFVFLAEYVAKKTKYLLSIYVLIEFIIGIYLTVIASDIGILSFYSIIASSPLLFGLVLWYFVFIKPTSEIVRKRMIFTMVGLIIVAIALILRSRVGTIIFWNFSQLACLIGNIMAIVGVVLVWYGFSALQTLSDLGWKAKLREIFVISSKGVALYAFSFDQNEPLQDSDLIAGGFSGIQLLLSEIVKTEESLNLIEYHNLKILVKQEKDLIFILILKEESTYLQYKLERFSDEFQDFFKEILVSWDGQIDTFIPTRRIIQQVFEISSS